MASSVTFIARLRKLLLLSLVVGVAVLGGLFLFGRMGKQPVRPAADVEDTKAGEGTTLIGQDFDYTFTDKERPIFRIRGESIRVDQHETIFLDKVGLTLYDEEGHEYHVESRQASFNQGQNHGRLQGDVVLRGPGGLELRTAQLQLRDKGQTLFCPRIVQMRYAGQYMARADRLRVFLPEDTYLLVGKVRVASLPGAEKPVSLTAQRVVYERKARLLRVEGHAELHHGADFLKALRITSYLSADESSLVFVRGLWDVTGRAKARDQEAGGDTTVNFGGKDLSVLLEPEGNQVKQVDLQGTPRQPARIETVGGGVTRLLTSQRLEGLLGDQGVLASAEAFEGVVLRETGVLKSPRGGAPAKGTRQARGQHAHAGFTPDGRIASISLDQNVTYQDGEVSAQGDRAVVDLESGQGEFFGSPVDVASDRGQVTSPRVLYNKKDQLVHALGGVRAVLEQKSETALAGTPLGEGEGPVHVESREALWRQSPSAFMFRGDVRAWRGESLLLAPELFGDNEKNQLTASGGVKSLWVPAADQAGKAGGPSSKKGTGKKPAPVEVTSSEMLYIDPKPGTKGTLTYTGNVRVLQEGKTLTCEKLDVELGQDKQAETMTCTGKAHLKDPATGRDIEGDRAVYHLDRRQIEMFGAPMVTMRDKEGNVVQGRRLLYFIDDGKVEVKGGEAPAAPSGQAGGGPSGGTGG